MSVNAASGVGVNTPVNNYTAAITEMFPRPNKLRMLETSIASKQDLDILPINATFDNKITDKYVEFRIPKASGSFIDMSSLALELKLRITKGDGLVLDNNDNIVLANGLLHTLFKSVSVFLSGVQVENNYMYGYSSLLKLFTTLNPYNIGKLGRNAFFYRDDKGSGIVDTYGDDYFNNLNKLEKTTIKRIKEDGLHLCGPLLLDLCGIDSYLIDDVDVSIRMEFASPSFVINTNQDGSNYKLHIDLCKLWVTRVFPQPEAMLALNTALNEPGSFLEYVYNKQVIKSYVIGQNQNSIAIDLPWGNCIPSRLYAMIINMEAYSGTYKKNPLFLRHSDLNGISVSVNGRTVHNFSVSLPKQFAPLYHYTLKALGLEQNHLLSYDSFTTGRMIIALDLLAEDVKEALDPEFTGNLRINMNFSKAASENQVLLLFGDTQGIIKINSSRQIYSDVRA